VKILIIEDYEGDVDLLLSRLKAIGCETVVAKTADEGLRLAIEQKPGLIVTDLNLGGGVDEGIDMVSKLRAHPETAAIPLVIHSVFVSAPADMPAVTADGYLPKPYRFVDLTKLVARIRDAQVQ
jgi:CheY-like chemotaxis protein